ncbi:uncharacterized protein VTP21DRAFT_5545 [Calcarisporiella thermophila]|uniref:uncharacterized protein n=1 Tax=Calcarisporiella thermophila TaxID=911321 RepID=UPI003742F7F6
MSRSVRQSHYNQNLNHRTALFGESSTSDLGGRLSPAPPSGGRYSPARHESRINDRELDTLESQNEERIKGLHDKVSTLKSLTSLIGEEIRESNKFLDTMGEQFQNTGTILSSTMTRFKRMAAQQSGFTLCYLILFLVFSIMFMYYFFFRW